MGASTLGEGFYGGPKPRQSFGSSSSAMMGIRESEESTSSSWTSRPSAIAPASRFPSTNLPSPPIPSSYPSPHLSKHPLSNPTTEPLDPLLKRSLIHLFFQNLSDPLCSIFHRPTFFASVYENQTSSLLLNAIYAWSARFSDHEAFDASKGERSQRGEPFAEEVRRVVERRGWKEETISRSLGATDEEEMETAQALVLMVMYETLTRRGARTEFYLG
ncbi:hypothetical protein BDY24DRAFT_175851 [Mrakia frigida]|uniref:fungal specific transcription factor domain-containing protein n=1 Tax=Mrakia frigida TaxID=29902 RepID=UPI003FCC1345